MSRGSRLPWAEDHGNALRDIPAGPPGHHVIVPPVQVRFTRQAEAELDAIADLAERAAVENAIEKLKAVGNQLAYPHSSQIEGGDRLRELRPRRGRSRWRAFYRQIGESFVIGSIGPEAAVNPRAFRQAVADAKTRLNEIERRIREHDEKHESGHE